MDAVLSTGRGTPNFIVNEYFFYISINFSTDCCRVFVLCSTFIYFCFALHNVSPWALSLNPPATTKNVSKHASLRWIFVYKHAFNTFSRDVHCNASATPWRDTQKYTVAIKIRCEHRACHTYLNIVMNFWFIQFYLYGIHTQNITTVSLVYVTTHDSLKASICSFRVSRLEQPTDNIYVTEGNRYRKNDNVISR